MGFLKALHSFHVDIFSHQYTLGQSRLYLWWTSKCFPRERKTNLSSKCFFLVILNQNGQCEPEFGSFLKIQKTLPSLKLWYRHDIFSTLLVHCPSCVRLCYRWQNSRAELRRPAITVLSVWPTQYGKASCLTSDTLWSLEQAGVTRQDQSPQPSNCFPNNTFPNVQRK